MLEALHNYRLTRLNRRPDVSGIMLAARGLSRRIGEKKRHHCVLCCSAPALPEAKLSICLHLVSFGRIRFLKAGSSTGSSRSSCCDRAALVGYKII